MPPHSDCHYTSALDSWKHVKTGFFCGASIPASTSAPGAPASSNNNKKKQAKLPMVLEFEEPSRTPPSPPQYPNGTKRPKSQTNIRSSRRVRFETEVEIYEIPNVRDFPKSQLAEMYMTKEEMAAIHAEAWEIVELMNLGIDYVEADSFSKRGLVDLKEDNVDRRRRMREQAYKVVFGMQSMHLAESQQQQQQKQPHWDFGDGASPETPIVATKPSYSPQIMADLYMQVSTLSKNMAHRTAMYDALAAGNGQ